jgi:hypothetical protein
MTSSMRVAALMGMHQRGRLRLPELFRLLSAQGMELFGSDRLHRLRRCWHLSPVNRLRQPQRTL